MFSAYRSIGPLLLAAVFLMSSGCGSYGERGDAQRAGEKEIRDLVARTNAAVVNRDREAFLSYYDHDVALVLPGSAISYGLDRLRKNGFPEGYALKMVTAKVEVFGDLGYAFGTYEQTSPDHTTGSLKNTVGKWMSVFKKETDGSWRAVADTYNVDPAS